MKKYFPVDKVAAEIRSREFARALPQYVAHAATLLRQRGMGERARRAPGAAEVGDVINDTVADCLAGTRRWAEGVPFGTFFRDAVKSHVYHLLSKEKKRGGIPIEDVDEPPAPSLRRDQAMDACAKLARVREVLSGDPRTRALLEAIEDGAEKRADVAEKLGWEGDEVTAVRFVALRRLAAARVHRDDGGKEGS